MPWRKAFKRCLRGTTEVSKNYKEMKDGVWLFTCYTFAPGVIIAERRVPWFNHEALMAIWEYFKEKKCRFYWDSAETETAKPTYTRKKTRVEIYKKYPEEMPLEKKIANLKKILNEVPFDNVPQI